MDGSRNIYFQNPLSPWASFYGTCSKLGTHFVCHIVNVRFLSKPRPSPMTMTQGSWCMMANGQEPLTIWHQTSNSQSEINKSVVRRTGQDCDVARTCKTGPGLAVWQPRFPLASTWALPCHFECLSKALAISFIVISEGSQCLLHPAQGYDICWKWC